MTKKKGAPMPAEAEPIAADPPQVPAESPKAEERTEANVPKHRRCPTCWGRDKGVGQAYHTRGRVRYYRCDACPMSWSVYVAEPEIRTQEPPDLSER